MLFCQEGFELFLYVWKVEGYGECIDYRKLSSDIYFRSSVLLL
jgi:hypothetical protein